MRRASSLIAAVTMGAAALAAAVVYGAGPLAENAGPRAEGASFIAFFGVLGCIVALAGAAGLVERSRLLMTIGGLVALGTGITLVLAFRVQGGWQGSYADGVLVKSAADELDILSICGWVMGLAALVLLSDALRRGPASEHASDPGR